MRALIFQDCAQCGQEVHVPPMDITFCSPEHCSVWQQSHTAEEITNIFEGRHFCQWCEAPLHEKSHGVNCPVLDLDTPRRRYSGFYLSHKTVVKLAKFYSPYSQYWGDDKPAFLKEGAVIPQQMYDYLAVGIGSQINSRLVRWVRDQPKLLDCVLYDAAAKRWSPALGASLLYLLGIPPEEGAILVNFGGDFREWLCRHEVHVVEGWKMVNEGTSIVTKPWERA